MDVPEQFRQAIDREAGRLRASIPPDRRAAISALIRALHRLPQPVAGVGETDLVAGRRLPCPGANQALRLCLEGADSGIGSVPDPADGRWDAWAVQLLDACGRLAEAELVLAHAETGFMRIVSDDQGTFTAWIATRRAPADWRERPDIDWWATWLADRHALAPRRAKSERSDSPNVDTAGNAHYLRLARAHLERMTYQLGYPPEAEIGGCSIRVYLDVLTHLIARALRTHDAGRPAAPQPEPPMIAAIAADLGIDPTIAARAVAAFTLDAENAAWHAAVPGVAGAPLVRIGPDEIVLSLHGLTTEPLFFLTRELRRRVAQEYHNAAWLREGVFRRDLYDRFPDRRFVTSAGRIQLRRERGDIRTDVDAAIFDRKTGTLGVFELKSQDPFVRSAAERTRQRDNFLHANRQVSGILTWLNRHGADEILDRIDHRTAKSFRVQKVYPFVLGRYLAHFDDGPEPDRRAAWGSWPQVLRLLDGPPRPARRPDANPLMTLFTRLSRDIPTIAPPTDALSREIVFGTNRLIVHPSYAAFRQRMAAGDDHGSR